MNISIDRCWSTTIALSVSMLSLKLTEMILRTQLKGTFSFHRPSGAPRTGRPVRLGPAVRSASDQTQFASGAPRTGHPVRLGPDAVCFWFGVGPWIRGLLFTHGSGKRVIRQRSFCSISGGSDFRLGCPMSFRPDTRDGVKRHLQSHKCRVQSVCWKSWAYARATQ